MSLFCRHFPGIPTHRKFDPSKVNRVFVYGSLMKGKENHRVMENSMTKGEFARMAYTSPMFDLVGFDQFPGMILGKSMVRGEIYIVDSFHDLDILEGHPHFYRRVPVFVGGIWCVTYMLTKQDEYKNLMGKHHPRIIRQHNTVFWN